MMSSEIKIVLHCLFEFRVDIRLELTDRAASVPTSGSTATTATVVSSATTTVVSSATPSSSLLFWVVLTLELIVEIFLSFLRLVLLLRFWLGNRFCLYWCFLTLRCSSR